MKKILISLAIIGIVAGATLGITGAWFTDDEPIEDNIFQAGTLDIQQGANDLGNMTLSGLMPGVATIPQKLTMGNDGTLHAILDKIEVTSLTNSDTAGTSNDISAADYAAMVNVTISDEIGRPLWKGTLADLSGGNAIDGTDRVFLAKKGSGGNYTTRDYWFTFELDKDATNAYQDEGVNATFTVNATQVKDNKFDAAERLVLNQNDDNGWDWVEDNNTATSDVDVHKSNLSGVIGTGLLRAYEFTGNTDYFDVAEGAAYEIANNWCTAYTGDKTTCAYARTRWEAGGAYTNEDIVFLQRMGKYWGASNLFSTKAEAAIVERWDAYNNDAQEVYDFIKGVRSSSPDFFYWDLAPLMEATVDAANTIADQNEAMILRNNALALAALVADDQKSDGWFTNGANADYQLGQASAIRILQLANDADFGVDYTTDINQAVNALWGHRNSADYSFKSGEDKSIQVTAYVALAFEMAGHHNKAEKAVEYIDLQQLSNGGWIEWINPADETEYEYPEVNSEALRAMVSVNQ